MSAPGATITENTFWQLLNQGVGRGFLFVFYLVVPLAIGLEEYGRFAFVFSCMVLFAQPAIVLGLDFVVAKRAARGDSTAVGTAAAASVLLFLVTGAAAAGVGAALGTDVAVIGLLWVYLGLLSFQNLLFAHFRGLEWMKMEGVIGTSQKLLALPLLAALAWVGIGGPVLPAACLALMIAAGFTFMIALYGGRIAGALSGGERQRVRADLLSFLREGLPIGLSAFVAILYFRIDTVMLGLLVGDRSVGAYNIAYRLMEGALIVPVAFVRVAFPRLVKAQDFGAVLDRWAALLGLIGVVVAAAMYAGADIPIELLYGVGYDRSGETLAVLALAIPPLYLGILLTQALIARDRHGTYLGVSVLGVVLNVGANLVLIPRFEEIGAAAATVATELAIAVVAALALRSSRPHRAKV